MSGIGMQGLAILAKKQGYEVSGFDDNEKSKYLQNFEIKYDENFSEKTDFVIFSSAIKPDHILIKAAKIAGIPCLNRTDFLLNHIKFNSNLILVAGAHGKTTTSSFIAYIFGLKSYLIGGIINGETGPANCSEDKFSIIETDESDGSFLKWSAKIPASGAKNYKILTTFDFEHMDHFKTEENITAAFQKYIFDNLENSVVIIEKAAYDSLEVAKMAEKMNLSTKNIITFSNQKYCLETKTTADFVFHDLEFESTGLKFKINEKLIQIPLFGEHNASNFTAIYALLNHLGTPYETVQNRIENFPGIKKRLQKITQKNEFTIFSDYGHHPKEISAVLAAFTLHKKHKPDVIIEMHRYTRLQYTWLEWPKILKGYKVFLLPIHSANEAPIEGISIENLIVFLQKNGIEAEFLPDFNQFSPQNDTICFSAGKLSSLLDKIEK